MAQKEALVQYLQKTSERLSAEGFSATEEELKKNIAPKVADGVRRLSVNAPAEVRQRLRTTLEESKVLPSFEADLETLRAAIAKCIDILEGKNGADAGPQSQPSVDSNGKDEVAEAAEESQADDQAEPRANDNGPENATSDAEKADVDEEEEEACTAEQTPEVEAEVEAEAGSPAGAPDSSHGETADAAGDDAKDDKAEDATPATAPTNGSDEKGNSGQGREALVKYLRDTRDRLSADGFAPEEKELKGRIMPSVVTSVIKLSQGAPNAMRMQMKAAFEHANVLPKYEADLDSFRASLEKCVCIVEDKAKTDGYQAS